MLTSPLLHPDGFNSHRQMRRASCIRRCTDNAWQ
jgi:hypothetical protein